MLTRTVIRKIKKGEIYLKNYQKNFITFIFTVLMIVSLACVTVGATPAPTEPVTIEPTESVTVESIVIETVEGETIPSEAVTEVLPSETQLVIQVEPTEASAASNDTATADETVTEKEPPNYGFFIGIGAIVLGGIIATAIVGYKLKNREEEEEE